MNKKELLGHITDIVPEFVKNIADYYKTGLDTKAKELVDNSSGSIGLALKLIAKPLIDKYFDFKKKEILANYGTKTYLKAAIIQATNSFEIACENVKLDYDIKILIRCLRDTLNQSVTELNDSKDLLLVFQRKYHPVVLLVKKSFENLMSAQKIDNEIIKKFILNFNENISNEILTQFGDAYLEHLKQIEQKIVDDNMANLLWDTIELGRIGFRENENLQYEETFGSWVPVPELNKQDIIDNRNYRLDDTEIDNDEKHLSQVSKLVDNYFDFKNPNNHIGKVLFIIADFGKGKSVFLRKYSADLAKNYFETNEGYIPVYFNLRNFKKYYSDHKHGVIADYLETDYKLKLDDEQHKQNKFIFLVDSLDESGELNKSSIEAVINSVKMIHNIDKVHCTENKIIITSRPFDDGLKEHLNQNEPFTKKNKENRDVPQYISLYGFKKKQFNNWLLNTLNRNTKFKDIIAKGYLAPIINAIKGGNKNTDVYKSLLENRTLSKSELRRPIFAYMVSELILNEIDFTDIGKIGIYLSFLNLLTKEAKYVNDPTNTINLIEQYEARNILHSIASLWNYQRRVGGQGALKKADICRLLDGFDNKETDNTVIERYKGKGVNEIQFLSHSYFGENDSLIHFQHQSFAEILLAEYYLKVFIKFALDPEFNFENARLKLIIGEPTYQTISFLKELLELLKQTVLDKPKITKELLQKRQLLSPLLASLANIKYNKHLFSNVLNIKWFSKIVASIENNSTKLPEELLKDWPIDSECLEKVIALCKEIMESNSNYYSLSGDQKTSLYTNETFKSQVQLYQVTPDIDKWLALLVGNVLENSIQERKFFNNRFATYQPHFSLLKNWNYYSKRASPLWGEDLFMGLNLKNSTTQTDLSEMNLYSINFSYSYLNKVTFEESNLRGCALDFTTLENVDFCFSKLSHTSFKSIKIVDFTVDFTHSIITSGVLMPYGMCQKYWQKRNSVSKDKVPLGIYVNYGSDGSILGRDEPESFDYIYHTISELIIHGIMKSVFTINDVKSWFKFESTFERNKFYNRLESDIKKRIGKN